MGAEPRIVGVDPVRLKHYPAASGYVYEYFFEERQPDGGGERFVFRIQSGKGYAAATVMLPAEALSACRELSATERYAIAKMSLFAAFDERADPAAMSEPVVVTAEGAAGILRTLDLA